MLTRSVRIRIHCMMHLSNSSSKFKVVESEKKVFQLQEHYTLNDITIESERVIGKCR